ncbi:OsmC family protein [Mucilaginibacter arboris]|uniref:OsmC family peroxiredoxin n=1 Tax=Mucilaginibacter arboris TaxID=2682090 RepID=A0A7K1SW05_9SPHI|nr:OsmC family protein [Mucilaginibacter arboris]MVN21505.1 OsmC family peroxiredoxin [Mucilaginibacter arboris]
MATIETVYQGTLRTEATHVQSGTAILTDAPVDNKGKGEAFSPTDLLAAALGSCMLTIMGIAAREHQINIDHTTCSITKIMAANPRRVGEIVVNLKFPETYTDKQQKILERAALTCPVYLSLNPDIKKTVSFGW